MKSARESAAKVVEANSALQKSELALEEMGRRLARAEAAAEEARTEGQASQSAANDALVKCMDPVSSALDWLNSVDANGFCSWSVPNLHHATPR